MSKLTGLPALARILCLSAAGALSLEACAPPAPPVVQAPVKPSAPVLNPPAETSILEDKSLDAHLRAESVRGTIALYDTATGEVRCNSSQACQKQLVPANTFAIAEMAVGFESGTLKSLEDTFPWGGKAFTAAEWNQDHTVRSAMSDSCTPCFEQLAERVGAKSWPEWLGKLSYGQTAPGEKSGLFWLDGPITISALGQVDFLFRLDQGKLPLNEQARKLTVESLPVEAEGDAIVRNKRGSVCGPRTEWSVGLMTAPNQTIYFAVALDGRAEGADPAVDVGRAAFSVALRALRETSSLRIEPKNSEP
jgi:beta-lactamase class D